MYFLEVVLVLGLEKNKSAYISHLINSLPMEKQKKKKPINISKTNVYAKWKCRQDQYKKKSVFFLKIKFSYWADI